MALTFSFKEFTEEIVSLEGIAGRYIARESVGVLQRLRVSLENVRSQPGSGMARWEIPENEPLRTIVSNGDYEPDGNGQDNVSAAISSVWEIEPFGNRERGGSSKLFRLVGIASTRVRILRHTPEHLEEEVAMWRMEVGDDAAPGCRFHVQILGYENLPFPHSIPIPRLPSILISPMTVFEFVVGELFQDSWLHEAARVNANMNLWRTIQRQRFSRLLGWLGSAVESTTGSPWLSLKKAPIEQDLFTR